MDALHEKATTLEDQLRLPVGERAGPDVGNDAPRELCFTQASETTDNLTCAQTH